MSYYHVLSHVEDQVQMYSSSLSGIAVLSCHKQRDLTPALKYWQIYQVARTRVRLKASGTDISGHGCGPEPAKMRVNKEPSTLGMYAHVYL